MRLKRRFAGIAGKNSVFHKYLISYASLALTAGMVAGLVFLVSSLYKIERVTCQETQERMQIAADYLDTFEEMITDIAIRVKTDAAYDSSYLEKSVLREKALIEQFARFKDYSPLIHDYCLYYPRKDTVYTDSTKCSFDLYSRYVLKVSEAELLKREWTEENLNRWYRSALLPDRYIYVRPIIRRADTVLLVFLLDRPALERYLSGILGLAGEGALQVLPAAEEIKEDSARLNVLTGTKSFRLWLDVDDHYDSFRGYLMNGVGWLLIIITALLMLAVYAAYRSYLPIHRLMYKYIPSESRENDSELEVIEETLINVLRDKSHSQRQVQKMLEQVRDQQTVLRQFFADELLNGHVNESMQYSLQLAGIDFPHRYFMLVMASGVRDADLERIYANLEGVSDESMHLFAARLPRERRIVVFVNLREADNVLYVMEIMASIFESVESVQYSEVVSALEQLNGAWKTLNDQRTPKTFEDGLERVSAQIRSGNSESALQLLRGMFNALSERTGMEKNAAYLAIIRCICNLASENHVSLGTECTRHMLLVENEQQFLSVITPVVYELASAACQGIDHAEARRLIDCIDQHLGNYELSREWVAQECRMSEYVVGRIFRNVIKMSYTDYVRIRRLNKAKELLVSTDMTVTAIGNSLGYINISYFIRAFKEYVGTTPALYRAEGMAQRR